MLTRVSSGSLNPSIKDDGKSSAECLWVYVWDEVTSGPSLLVFAFGVSVPANSPTCPSSLFQERQRLETILSLCAEYTKPDSGSSTGTTVADVQKINKELERLQLSDEESVFEEALVSPDTRYRCHRKGSVHDVDLAVFGSLGQSTASFLSPRSVKNEDLLRDLTRTPPPASSAFLKASSESAYLSILPKVKPTWTQGLGLCVCIALEIRGVIMLVFQNVFCEASI